MLSADGRFTTPQPKNEPVLSYRKGSPERISLQACLAEKTQQKVEIPCVVGGKRYFTGRTIELTMPSDHGHVLATAHLATPEIVEKAIQNSLQANAKSRSKP